MHIIITGIHVEITDAIRTYTLTKLDAIKKYVPRDDTSAKLSVELSKTTAHHAHGDIFQAEAQIHIRGKESTVRATENDLYKAIDVLKDMITREMVSHKNKEQSRMRRGASHVKALLKRLLD